jgi:hypothetical protein
MSDRKTIVFFPEPGAWGPTNNCVVALVNRSGVVSAKVLGELPSRMHRDGGERCSVRQSIVGAHRHRPRRG